MKLMSFFQWVNWPELTCAHSLITGDRQSAPVYKTEVVLSGMSYSESLNKLVPVMIPHPRAELPDFISSLCQLANTFHTEHLLKYRSVQANSRSFITRWPQDVCVCHFMSADKNLCNKTGKLPQINGATPVSPAVLHPLLSILYINRHSEPQQRRDCQHVTQPNGHRFF